MTYRLVNPWMNTQVGDMALMGVSKFTPLVGVSTALGIASLGLGIFGISKAFGKGRNKVVKAGIPVGLSVAAGVAAVVLFNIEKKKQSGVVGATVSTPRIIVPAASNVPSYIAND